MAICGDTTWSTNQQAHWYHFSSPVESYVIFVLDLSMGFFVRFQPFKPMPSFALCFLCFDFRAHLFIHSYYLSRSQNSIKHSFLRFVVLKNLFLSFHLTNIHHGRSIQPQSTCLNVEFFAPTWCRFWLIFGGEQRNQCCHVLRLSSGSGISTTHNVRRFLSGTMILASR